MSVVDKYAILSLFSARELEGRWPGCVILHVGGLPSSSQKKHRQCGPGRLPSFVPLTDPCEAGSRSPSAALSLCLAFTHHMVDDSTHCSGWGFGLAHRGARTAGPKRFRFCLLKLSGSNGPMSCGERRGEGMKARSTKRYRDGFIPATTTADGPGNARRSLV